MNIPEKCLQVVVVEAGPGSAGTLQAFSRTDDAAEWELVAGPFAVVLGRSGVLPSRDKREGDGATPAGVFPLVSSFGRQALAPGRLPYLALTPTSEAVDDPRSKHYNEILDAKEERVRDWVSSEALFRDDDLYDLAIVVGYNLPPAVPGCGSCIFLHIWKDAATPTSGCVAMARDDISALLQWLDPSTLPHIAIKPVGN